MTDRTIHAAKTLLELARPMLVIPGYKAQMRLTVPLLTLLTTCSNRGRSGIVIDGRRRDVTHQWERYGSIVELAYRDQEGYLHLPRLRNEPIELDDDGFGTVHDESGQEYRMQFEIEVKTRRPIEAEDLL